jgi:hypothetical protein
MTARAILLTATLALAGAAGCGEDDDGGSEPSAPARDAGIADACELVTRDEIEASVRRVPESDRRSGDTLDGFALSQCVWEAGDRRLAVAVVESSARYRQHERRGRGEPVRELGDAALVETGTSLEDRGGTGGRTVFVLDGDRTLVVAFDHGGETRVSMGAVVDLARSAHARLP